MEWLYQYGCRAHATLPGRGRNPQPADAGADRPEARRSGLHGNRLPRHRRAVRRHRLRRAAVPAAAARRRSDGDAHLRRPGRRLRRPRPEQRLVGPARPRPRRRDARPAPRPGAQRRAARGRPADHRDRRRPRRPSAHLAARRRRLRRLRLPHVQADDDHRQQDERGPGVLGLRGAAVQPSTRGRAATPSSAPACTPRRRRRWVATPPWRARGSTSDRPAGRRWSTRCWARSTPSASGSRTTR